MLKLASREPKVAAAPSLDQWVWRQVDGRQGAHAQRDAKANCTSCAGRLIQSKPSSWAQNAVLNFWTIWSQRPTAAHARFCLPRQRRKHRMRRLSRHRFGAAPLQVLFDLWHNRKKTDSEWKWEVSNIELIWLGEKHWLSEKHKFTGSEFDCVRGEPATSRRKARCFNQTKH